MATQAKSLFEENAELRAKLKRIADSASKNAAGRKQNKQIVSLRQTAERLRLTVDANEAKLEELVKIGELVRPMFLCLLVQMLALRQHKDNFMVFFWRKKCM